MNQRRPIGVTLLLAWLLPATSSADTPQWLEWIRSYDLNDYAVGVAVTTSQSPYVGAENSTWAYPYLTSFRHYSLTDDWLVLRDGGAGFRGVSRSGWTYGVFGRVNTGGLGPGDPPELRGLKERQWSLEAGPFVGWRGWPLQVQLDTYYEITGRHDGYSADLELSWPREHRWGYIVPSLHVVYVSDAYNDYFFGISPPEVLPERPSYTAGSDTNLRARLEYGYRIGERWLISGNVTANWYGDETTSSPIVDRDSTLSVNLGVAYNADLFNSRHYPHPDTNEPQLEMRFGAFYDNVSTQARRTDGNGIPGDRIEFDSLAGDDSQWVAEAALFLRIGNYHRLEFNFFELGRDSNLVATNDIEFGDLLIPANTEMRVKSEFSSIVVAYSYSFMRDAQKELGLTAGLHFTNFDNRIDITGGGSEATNEQITLPVIGAHGSLALGEKMKLSARLQIFASDVDRYEGNLYYATLDLAREISDAWRVGLGLNLYDLKLSSSRDSIRGDIETRHFGPVLYVSAGF